MTIATNAYAKCSRWHTIFVVKLGFIQFVNKNKAIGCAKDSDHKVRTGASQTVSFEHRKADLIAHRACTQPPGPSLRFQLQLQASQGAAAPLGSERFMTAASKQTLVVQVDTPAFVSAV